MDLSRFCSDFPNDDNLGESHDEQPVNQPAEPSTEESEYEETNGTGGEESDNSLTFSFRDRYNLRNAKTKAPSSTGATADEASHKRNKMDSTPTGSDEEGHAKKLFKQHEDSDMADAALGVPSATNPL